LQALHRVRERLVSQRTGIINQIRAFLLERGVAVRQGLRFLRAELPRILAAPCDALSPRMLRVIEDLSGDWRRLDERIEGLSSEIEALALQDGPEHKRLQSKAEYIDPRPHIRQLDESSLATHGRTIHSGQSRRIDRLPAIAGCPLCLQ